MDDHIPQQKVLCEDMFKLLLIPDSFISTGLVCDICLFSNHDLLHTTVIKKKKKFVSINIIRSIRLTASPIIRLITASSTRILRPLVF